MTLTAPAESLYGLARPTRRRWEPLRAGITGLFRYDEQVFTFHRGRLLLRGNNGSGKSMALEVLLPYVLDADLAPERLSTFGVRDRGMFVWLLGHDGNQDRTSARGYVWVEFGRVTDEGEEFYTVGAGLHGTRANKRVSAWYFTTSGRVGHDFELGGAGSEPMSSAQLSQALADLTANGVPGRVQPTPDSYRREVNRVLFGLEDRQFEALRKTLLHLRKPKLSDKLSEGKLDELLRDSLPPVSQTVTNELADGFERLDRHREVIRELTAAHTALTELTVAYTDYLDVVVSRRAADVVDAVRQIDETTTLAAAAVTEHAKAEGELNLARQQVKAMRNDVRSLGAEIEAIKELDLYKEGAQLVPLREKATALHESAKSSRTQADELKEAATRSREAATTAQQEADAAIVMRDDRAARADSIAGRLPQDALPTLASTLVARIDRSPVDGDAALTKLRDSVRTCLDEIDQLRALVARAHKAAQLFKAAQETTTKMKERVVKAEMDADKARSTRHEQLTSYLDAAAEWIARSPQLVLGASPPETWPTDFPGREVSAWCGRAAEARRTALTAETRALEKIPPTVNPLVREATELSRRCDTLGTSLSRVWTMVCGARDARIDFAEQVQAWSADLCELSRAADVPESVHTPVPRTLTRTRVVEWATTAATVRLRALEREAAVVRSELASVGDVLDGKRAEHSRLSQGGLPALRAPHTRLADRRRLTGSPFFLLVDFVVDGDQEDDRRALLEAAIVGSGLADAWVFPDGTIAAGPDGGPLLDVQLTAAHPLAASPLSAALRPDPALPADGPVPADVVRAVLARVELADTARGAANALTVAWDGTWAAGPLHGAYHKDSVDLIGAGSREAMRQRRMAELATEIAELELASSSLRERIQHCEDAANRADQERVSVPSDELVRGADAEQANAIGLTTALLHRIVEDAETLVTTGRQVTTNALRTFTSLGLPPDEPPVAQLALADLEGDVTSGLASMPDMVWSDNPVEPDDAPIAAAVQAVGVASAGWQAIATRAAEAVTSVVRRSSELDRQVQQQPSDTPLAEATVEVDVKTRIVQDRVVELTTAQDEENTAAGEHGDAVAAAETALEVAGLSGHSEQLDGLRAETERFRSAAEDWINAAAHCARLMHAAGVATANADEAEEISRRSAGRATTAEQEAALAQQKYNDLNTQMGRPHQELMHKLGLLQVKRDGQGKALDERVTEEIELGRIVERRSHEVETARGKADAAKTELSATTNALADVHRLGLLRIPDVVEQPARFGPEPLHPDQVETVCGWARLLAPRTHRTADQQDRAQTMAVRVRNKVESALAGQVVLRERVDCGVLALSGSRNGHERSVPDTLTALAQDLTQTEQLLEKEEAELFERFLSDEVRLEVGQRIQAARSLVDRMNALMKGHPTSSGYVFKLRWEAAPDCEMPTDMMRLLEKPEGTLYQSERERLSEFYRRRIAGTRATTASSPWRDQLATMLDYRLWHRFDLLTKQGAEEWGKLDRRRHGSMSGGEKAVALHMPLFAAAATHCEASRLLVNEEGRTSPGCPRLILLDEVFAGVDAKNRGALFDLITRLDLDLVATSESELGMYPELDGISIYHLIVDDALPGVLAARSVWDGQASHDMLDHDLESDT